MFLQTYQLYFWLAALVFTAATFYFYRQQKIKLVRDRNLLFINAGLLIFGLPFIWLSDYIDFFRFVGIALVFGGIILFILGRRIKEVRDYYDVATMPAFWAPKLTVQSVLFAIVLGGFILNQYFMYRMGIFNKANSSAISTTSSVVQTTMKLTAFDVALAKERMDKNNDGICDTCGMSIQQCIDSGQMECNMGSNSQAIGVLGSQHIHADWKIYINGKALDSNFFGPLAMDMSNPNKPTTSSFIHVDMGAPAPERVGDVIHMHAKNVPLWVFFRSVGMNLTKDSLTLADGKILKNENGNSIKFYLNGQKVDELGGYSFQPLDKLLISYGPVGDPDVQKQISSITNFAKDH